MTVTEVTALIKQTEGDFCRRLYRRRDGTVLTADCPSGAKAFSSGRLHRILTFTVLVIGFFASRAFLKPAKERELEGPPLGPGATFADWKDWALSTAGVPEGFAVRRPRIRLAQGMLTGR